jgi:hypothetical protein
VGPATSRLQAGVDVPIPRFPSTIKFPVAAYSKPALSKITGKTIIAVFLIFPSRSTKVKRQNRFLDLPIFFDS